MNRKTWAIALFAFGGAFAGHVGVPAAPASAQSSPDPETVLKLRWQRLMREAEERLADARHTLDSARVALDVAARQATLMPTGPNLAARAAAVEAVKAAEAGVGAATKAKEALLEQARREGAQPGWFR